MNKPYDGSPSDSDLLAELFREFDKINGLLVEALDHLDKAKHPFADVSDFWVKRHVYTAGLYLRVGNRLRQLRYPIKAEDLVFPEAAALPCGLPEDLMGLDLDGLAQLASEFTDGDDVVFVENYAYFHNYFQEQECETGRMTSDEDHVPGPYECLRCGEDLRAYFPDHSSDRESAPALVEVLRQRYACWVHIHDSGQHFCSCCQHMSEKDD